MIDWANQATAAAASIPIGLATGIASGIIVTRWQTRRTGSTGTTHSPSPGRSVPPAAGSREWIVILPARERPSRAIPEPPHPSPDDDDLLLWSALGLAAMMVLATLYATFADWVAAFVISFVVGLVVTVAAVTVARFRQNAELPPGAMLILVNAVAAGIVSVAAVVLTYLASYQGITLQKIHRLVGHVSGFRARMTAITHTFHSDGWFLLISLLLGLFAAVLVLSIVIVQMLSLMSVLRMRYGFHGRVTARLARSYSLRPDWSTLFVLLLFVALSLSLCSGLAVNVLRPGHPSNPVVPSTTTLPPGQRQKVPPGLPTRPGP